MDKVTTKNNTHELISRLIVLCEMVRESLRGPPATARSRGRLVVLVDRAVEVALVDQRLDGGPRGHLVVVRHR